MLSRTITPTTTVSNVATLLELSGTFFRTVVFYGSGTNIFIGGNPPKFQLRTSTVPLVLTDINLGDLWVVGNGGETMTILAY